MYRLFVAVVQRASLSRFGCRIGVRGPDSRAGKRATNRFPRIRVCVFVLGHALILQSAWASTVDPEALLEIAKTWYSGNSTPSVLLNVLAGEHLYKGKYRLTFKGSGAWSQGNLEVSSTGKVSGGILATIGSVRYTLSGNAKNDGTISAKITGLPATSFGTMSGTLCNPGNPPRTVTGSGNWYVNTIGAGTWTTEKTQ